MLDFYCCNEYCWNDIKDYEGAMTKLQHEIGKQRPFEDAAEEAYLNLTRTASILDDAYAQLFKRHGLRPSSYNVLRILRGAGACTCSEIHRDMVVRAPDVTRLVDRLGADGLVERRRDADDRRVVRVHLTRKGRAAVDRLDDPVDALRDELLGHMSDADLKTLSRLLEQARKGATT